MSLENSPSQALEPRMWPPERVDIYLAARSGLIRLLAERLVRDALSSTPNINEGHPDVHAPENNPSGVVRPLQLGQAGSDIH